MTINTIINNEIFLVKKAELKTTKNGSFYLDLTLVNKEGEINGKAWEWDVSYPEVKPMTLKSISGTACEFGGKQQIKISLIEDFDEAESEINISDYVPCSAISPELAFNELINQINLFENKSFKAVCQEALNLNKDKLLIAPAAMSCHDAVRGGLLHHTYKMLQCALNIVKVYPSINKELLFAGIILHDLAKLDELDITPIGIATGYTAKGNLIGHITDGAINLHSICKKLDIPDEETMLLMHMILSHHGKPEYGSAKIPMIPEAQVLNALDELDAKIYEFEEALKDVEPGELSPKVFSLGNISVYKSKL